jgi:hypothetical protein
MKTRTITSTLLALSFTVACASEEPAGTGNESQQPESRERAMRSAEATGKLLVLSNAAIGANQIGQRANFTEDLEGDIEVGIEEFEDSLQDPSCFSYDLIAHSDSHVEVRFDFSDCDADSGLEGIAGEFSVDIQDTDDDETLDCDFAGELDVDGYGFDGDWSVDIGTEGRAAIAGELDIRLPDGEVVSTLLDAVWSDVGSLCPSLTQHLDIGTGVDSIAIDLEGLDLCSGSLCGSEVGITIEGAEGLDEIDLSDYGAQVEGETDGLFCGDDGDFEDYGDFEDLGEDLDEELGDEDLGDEELPDGDF